MYTSSDNGFQIGQNRLGAIYKARNDEYRKGEERTGRGSVSPFGSVTLLYTNNTKHPI
jgi:hypothetical protein